MFSNKNRSQNIKLNHFFRKGCCIADDDANNKLCFWNGWPTKAVKPYFQPEHCQGFSQSQISDKPKAGFETAENQPELKVHHGTSYTWQANKLIHEHKWWYTETSSIPRYFLWFLEAVAQRSSVKKAFLKILQSSQESTCARASFLIKLQAWDLQLY